MHFLLWAPHTSTHPADPPRLPGTCHLHPRPPSLFCGLLTCSKVLLSLSLTQCQVHGCGLLLGPAPLSGTHYYRALTSRQGIRVGIPSDLLGTITHFEASNTLLSSKPKQMVLSTDYKRQSRCLHSTRGPNRRFCTWPEIGTLS